MHYEDKAVSNGDAVSRHEPLLVIASLIEVAGTTAMLQAYQVTKALQDINPWRHPPSRVFVFLCPTAVGPISGQPRTQVLASPRAPPIEEAILGSSFSHSQSLKYLVITAHSS